MEKRRWRDGDGDGEGSLASRSGFAVQDTCICSHNGDEGGGPGSDGLGLLEVGVLSARVHEERPVQQQISLRMPLPCLPLALRCIHPHRHLCNAHRQTDRQSDRQTACFRS